MGTFWSGFGNDARFAFRQIRRQPGFAFSAILVLALGVGASTAVFSVLYEALLKPLPYPQPNRIVFLHNAFPKSQLSLSGVSSLDYMEIKRHPEIFSKTGAYYFNDLTLTGAGAARHVDSVNVSAGLFRVLGVKPALGRTITDEDDRFGAPKVALLSDSFWRSAFGGSPAVLGRTIQLNEEPYTIIGVMPREFRFPYQATQLWLPIGWTPSDRAEKGRLDKWLNMVGRLAPGVTQEQAQAQLAAVGHRLAQQFPPFYPEASGWHFAIQPLVEEQTKSIRTWLFLAFGAVLCVLLIACSNVGGLLLIRSAARTGELAVRAALGAGKYRIVHQILTETGLLVFGGCGAGVMFAAWAVDLCNRYGPIGRTVRIEASGVLFAVTMALLSTFAAGLLPAFVSARLPLEQTLKSSAGRTASRASGWRYLLVAGQIAVAVTLVFTASLMTRSFSKLMQVPPGFAAAHVWSGSVVLPRREYRAPDARVRFFQELLRGVAALPGVESASAVVGAPFNPSGVFMADVSFPGRPETTNQPKAQVSGAMPGYFETMKIPLRAGRTFTSRDRIGAQRVLMIDEEFARLYFPNEDPIGKYVGVGGEAEDPSQIIGVVANVENGQLGAPHKPELYWPSLMEPSLAMYLVARTKGDVDITSAVRNQVANLNRNVALFDVATMDERVAQSLKLRRFIAFLLTGFGGMGLLLAALGLYGSLAHLVELRRREIGIRMALGAVWQDVGRIVAAQASFVIGLGILIGIAGAVLAGILVRNQLFGVRANDAVTWATVLGTLATVALLAAWLPVRRAIRIQPNDVLREE